MHRVLSANGPARSLVEKADYMISQEATSCPFAPPSVTDNSRVDLLDTVKRVR